jgi:hypothetical protein
MAEKEYIEREAARKLICGFCADCDGTTDLCEYRDIQVDAIPAADVRPVVRGEWVAEKEDVEWGCSTVRYRCSHCGRLPHFDKESYKFMLSDYCPKCGADMRGEQDDITRNAD